MLGHNGAGKSTLLRIMAGEDAEIVGEAQPGLGIRVGYLPQEPELDPSKDVLGKVEEGVAEIRALLGQFEEISARLAEPLGDDQMSALLEQQAMVQDAIDAANAWELDRTLEIAMDALRLPPGEAEIATLSGGEKRRIALCRLLLQKPDLPAARRPGHRGARAAQGLRRQALDRRP